MEGLHKSPLIVFKTEEAEHVRNGLYISLWLDTELHAHTYSTGPQHRAMTSRDPRFLS